MFRFAYCTTLVIGFCACATFGGSSHFNLEASINVQDFVITVCPSMMFYKLVEK
jgi:hypothetical protein